MARDSLIAIGRRAFEVMIRLPKKKTSEISRELEMSLQQVSNIKNDLIEAGWINPDTIKITKAGEYFVKAIYENPKVKARLKE